MVNTFGAVRAEALFASNLRPSQSPFAQQVRGAVTNMLRRVGVQGLPTRVVAHGEIAWASVAVPVGP
jgi:hypothetical protein